MTLTKYSCWSLLLLITLSQCQQPRAEHSVSKEVSTPQGIADVQSTQLITDAEIAMGGREAYDQAHILRWTFFGRRHLVWNKQTGDVRIDSPGDSTTYLVNVKDNTGRVQIGGEEITEQDSLMKLVEKGKSIWINDSYWLVMPWKLRDPGVTAAYIGTDTTQTGATADVLALTFDGVGVTPQNKYHVWITKDDGLVKQWSFYPNATDEAPRATWAWDNYQPVTSDPVVYLSFDRSDKTGPSRVAVRRSVPQGIFTHFDAETALQEAFKDI